MRRLIVVTGLFGILVFGRPAGAMEVFDPVNWAENLMTAQEAVKQTQNMIEQLKTQIQQYERMLKDALSLPDFVTGDLAKQIQDLENFKNNITGMLSNILGGGRGRLDDVIKEFYAPSDYKANPNLFADRNSLGDLAHSEMVGHELTKNYADQSHTLLAQQLEKNNDFNDRFLTVLADAQNAEGHMQIMQAQTAMMSLMLEKMGEIHQLLFASLGMQAARNETIVQQEVKEQIMGGILMGESEYLTEQLTAPAQEFKFFE